MKKRRYYVKKLRYYAFSFAYLGTAMWMSDYQYDWVLLIAGIFYGSFAILLLQEDAR